MKDFEPVHRILKGLISKGLNKNIKIYSEKKQSPAFLSLQTEDRPPHGPHGKRSVQEFSCCCVCIFATQTCLPIICLSMALSSGSTIPDFRRHITMFLPYDCSAISEAVMLVLLKGRIYEVRPFGWLRCHDIHTKFYRDWFRHSKVVKGNTHADT
jgi:hypothetical protein